MDSVRIAKWKAEAPARAARREARGRGGRAIDMIMGVGALLVLAAVVAALVGVVAALAWGIVASGAWKPLVGFLIAATVIAGISVGIQGSGKR